jgi:peptide/nickel transport system substrate-binding protein
LLTIDESLRVAPGLASRWETPDDLTYIVYLRQGVRFHDGHELTARDVVYTFNSFLDPKFVSPLRGAYALLESVRALNDYTVEFKLTQPFGSFPINLVVRIVPAGAGPGLRDHPIGTGPYQFVSITADDKVVVKAFPDYFQGPPSNRGVVLKIVPDDNMRGLELRKGSVDLIVNDLAPDIVWQLEGNPKLQVITSPGSDYAYIGINLRDPILRDVRVRHALAYAIDKDAIVQYLRRGLATAAVGILPPMAWAFEAHVPSFAHDAARARALLDEAGYRDPDGDGPQPRLRLSLKMSNVEFNRLQGAVIQQNLKEVGIDLDVRSYEFATLYADVLKGAFQLYTLQWVGVTDPDILRRVFHSSQVPPVGFNRGYYRNPVVDRLIDEATVSTDADERRRLYAEAQRLIAEDTPYISLWYKTNVAVAQNDLEGLHLLPAADFAFLRNVRRVPRQAHQ